MGGEVFKLSLECGVEGVVVSFVLIMLLEIFFDVGCVFDFVFVYEFSVRCEDLSLVMCDLDYWLGL
jgi:hypothetical protein